MDLMKYLLLHCSKAKRAELLLATNHERNTGTCNNLGIPMHETICNVLNYCYYSAFMEACQAGNEQVFAFLLPLLTEHQVRMTENARSMTALLLAIKWGHTAMVTQLLDRGASPNGIEGVHVPLSIAVCVRSSTRTRCTNKRMTSINVCAIVGRILQAESNRMELVSLLLERGADIHRASRPKAKTCLHAACGVSRVSYDLVKLLLDKGADITALVSATSPLLAGMLAWPVG
jgi:ankyrin repeat protein